MDRHFTDEDRAALRAYLGVVGPEHQPERAHSMLKVVLSTESNEQFHASVGRHYFAANARRAPAERQPTSLVPGTDVVELTVGDGQRIVLYLNTAQTRSLWLALAEVLQRPETGQPS